MESSLLSVLPNLSIGVVSIAALVYITLQFLKTLDARSDKHERAMKEREDAMRTLETDIRRGLTTQLAQNTIALNDAAKILSKCITKLEKEV